MQERHRDTDPRGCFNMKDHIIHHGQSLNSVSRSHPGTFPWVYVAPFYKGRADYVWHFCLELMTYFKLCCFMSILNRTAICCKRSLLTDRLRCWDSRLNSVSKQTGRELVNRLFQTLWLLWDVSGLRRFVCQAIFLHHCLNNCHKGPLLWPN